MNTKILKGVKLTEIFRFIRYTNPRTTMMDELGYRAKTSFSYVLII